MFGFDAYAFGNDVACADAGVGATYCAVAFCGDRSRHEAPKGAAGRPSGAQTEASAGGRRRFARERHSRDSHRVMSGLVGLLFLCEQASGKSGVAARSLANLRAKLSSTIFQPRAVLRALGAKPLHCADAPDLYAILLNICDRARMERLPELFLLPAPDMNAFALGVSDNACILVTEGLLRGLSRDEIAGILAHEVAHILSGDTSAMNWAAAIQGEIANSALCGMAELAARPGRRAEPQALMLAAAPALARTLVFALSRVRELAADAMALDLIDQPGALAAALCKLEYFHTGRSPLHAYLQDAAFFGSLGSHPSTWEKLSELA